METVLQGKNFSLVNKREPAVNETLTTYHHIHI